jgi:hypothetical protein
VPCLVCGSMQLADRRADVIDQRLHVMPVAQKRCPACSRNGLCNVTRQRTLRRLESPLGGLDRRFVALDWGHLDLLSLDDADLLVWPVT